MKVKEAVPRSVLLEQPLLTKIVEMINLSCFFTRRLTLFFDSYILVNTSEYKEFTKNMNVIEGGFL
jgi:hypothetical protein